MALDEFEEGKAYLCKEKTTDSGHTGSLTLTKNGLSARIVAYQGAPALENKPYILLFAENGSLVSLHDNIVGEPGRTWAGAGQTASQNILSNFALAGRTPWLPTDLVKSTQFRIPRVKDALLFSELRKQLQTSDATKLDNTLLKVDLPNATFTIWYGYVLETFSHSPSNIDPGYNLEFEEPLTLREARRYTQCIVKFFSAMVGDFAWASNISVTKDELPPPSDDSKQPRNRPHRYYENTLFSNGSERSAWRDSPIALVTNEAELKALETSLKAWVVRENEWASATALMLASFRQNPSEFGPERLMAATRWFEEIPDTGAVPVLDPVKVQELADKMGELAKGMGLGDLAGRYAGAVKNVSRETRLQQIQRLVAHVRRRLGRAIPNSDLVPHVNAAYGFRGVAAHAGLRADSDEKFSRFCKATYAIECICYLLTVCDLPMTDAGRRNLGQSPRVKEFEHSYIVDQAGNQISG